MLLLGRLLRREIFPKASHRGSNDPPRKESELNWHFRFLLMPLPNVTFLSSTQPRRELFFFLCDGRSNLEFFDTGLSRAAEIAARRKGTLRAAMSAVRSWLIIPAGPQKQFTTLFASRTGRAVILW
jgi:hypothetical protein